MITVLNCFQLTGEIASLLYLIIDFHCVDENYKKLGCIVNATHRKIPKFDIRDSEIRHLIKKTRFESSCSPYNWSSLQQGHV
jgi:hypothetical protein